MIWDSSLWKPKQKKFGSTQQAKLCTFLFFKVYLSIVGVCESFIERSVSSAGDELFYVFTFWFHLSQLICPAKKPSLPCQSVSEH